MTKRFIGLALALVVATFLFAWAWTVAGDLVSASSSVEFLVGFWLFLGSTAAYGWIVTWLTISTINAVNTLKGRGKE